MKLTLSPGHPPRLVVRTLVATVAAIGLVLVAVFVVLSMDTRARLASAAIDNLEAAQRIFSEIEQHRQQESLVRLNAVAENRTLTAPIASYRPRAGAQGLQPLQRELDRLAGQLAVDAVVLVDPSDRILASAGPRRAAWLPDQAAHADGTLSVRPQLDELISRPSALFRVSAVEVSRVNPALGYIYLAEALDDGYANRLSTLLQAPVTLVFADEVVGTSLNPAQRSAVMRRAAELPEEGLLDLLDEPWALRRLNASGPVAHYAFESVGASTHRATRNALSMLGFVAIGAMVLGVLVSLWLARLVARPIDQLSQELRQMAEAQDFSRKVARTGSSLELDAFTDTFNQLVASLQSAEAQTELAYVGAIKALATALDARDTYTAGHSERVSALSLMIGRQMKLESTQIDVLRLGALLHDIGKIGVADRVLQKNGPLTQEEFELIKLHPTLGAHILRPIPFLSAHIPIVELHHERPDGRGYPHGLIGHATPLLARIVHVADAFDAMTTARAYRPAQTTSHAITELWRYAGSQFDAEVVEAFVSAWSALPVAESPADVAAVLARANILPFDRPTATQPQNKSAAS